MKKILIAILCVVYVIASSGATINFHYCMGKFIGWDVAASTPKTCSSCGMHKENKKGCCKDEHATLQLRKDQLASVLNNIPNTFFVSVYHQYSVLQNSSVSFLSNDDVQISNGPPLNKPRPSFIMHCVFRI